MVVLLSSRLPTVCMEDANYSATACQLLTWVVVKLVSSSSFALKVDEIAMDVQVCWNTQFVQCYELRFQRHFLGTCESEMNPL